MGLEGYRQARLKAEHGTRVITGPSPARSVSRRPWSHHPPAQVCGKLTVLSISDEPTTQISQTLAEIAGLPYVDSVLALPDVHHKQHMEIPSSIAITTRGVIVPEFTSAAINDGMGVVTTNLRADEMVPERLCKFFARINSHSAGHRFDMNPYSLSADELRRVLAEGGRAVISKYGLEEHLLDRMEWGGCVPIGGEGEVILTEVVPQHLLRTRLTRSEIGLNFGGNHFLEVQVVDQILNRGVASDWGLAEKQILVMYHLGPGPFSGTLLHHYSRRSKLRSLRVPLFFLSKLMFHYVQRMGDGAASRKWALHFKRNGWTPFPAKSEEGALLRLAIAMATNAGFAYRLGTVRAIQDALHEALSPHIHAELFWDVPHNSLYEETLTGESAWVARHNSCRLVPGKPTIVAGSSDVPSYLGIGLDGAGGRFHSYDHGAGNSIEDYRSSGRLGRGNGSVVRFLMTRGRNAKLVKREEVPGCSSEPIDRLMECLERNRIMRPVARLRPIGNLKN